MISAEVRIWSRSITPEMITEHLQLEASEIRHKDEPLRAVPSRRLETHRWTLKLSWPTAAHGGTRGRWRSLAALGDGFSDRLAELPRGDADVFLSSLQDVDGGDDPDTLGIQIDNEAILWLARANMSVDIDQYVTWPE